MNRGTRIKVACTIVLAFSYVFTLCLVSLGHTTTTRARATVTSLRLVPTARIASAIMTHRLVPRQQAAPAPHSAPAPAPVPAPQLAAPYYVYDSTVPTAIPTGQPAAVYATGAYATPDVVGHAQVLWIDTNGTDPAANALDVEPGDVTPQAAAPWVDAHLTDYPNTVAIVYTMRSDWPAVQASMGTLPAWMQPHVRYWIADPTDVPHVLPGSSATQWYWGSSYDISTADPNFDTQN